MTENWQAGDLALCIRNPKPCLICGKKSLRRAGVIYRVDRIDTTQFGVFLLLAELAPHVPQFCGCDGYHLGETPRNFRKVTPPKADAFDREVIELLRGAPAKVPA